MVSLFRNLFEIGRPVSSVVAAACAALFVLAATGCSSGAPFGPPPCMPPAFSVNPPSAKPGGAVTVSAPDATCDPRYGGDAQIQVTLTGADGVRVLDALAPMNDAGGFSYVFDVPAGTAAGEAALTAMPHNIDWCDDTGRNNRAAPGGPGVVLERVSCVIPTKFLTVIRFSG